MGDTSETVRIQLRIGNKIFVANVTSNAVTDIMINGEKSKIIEFLKKGDHESVVIGKFQKKVEVMDVAPVAAKEQNNNNNCVVESMEIEVSNGDWGKFYSCKLKKKP